MSDVYFIVKTKVESELPLLEDEYDDDDTPLVADDQLLEKSVGDRQNTGGLDYHHSAFVTDDIR